MNGSRNKTALSLVEMLVVIAIIAVLTGVMIGVAAYVDNQSKQRALKSTFAVLHGALQEYHDYWRTFPDPNKPNKPLYPSHSAALYAQLYATPTVREVLSQFNAGSVRHKYADMPEFVDPWGTVLDYLYVPGDTFPMLISGGPDRNLQTIGDNISNK